MLHVQSGGLVTIITEALHDGDPSNPVTGLGTVEALLWRWSGVALQYYDFNDSTWKALGSVTTLRAALSQVNAVEASGVYYLPWTAPTGDYTCSYVIRETSGTAKNVPQQGAISVGQWMDNLDAAITSRAAPGDAMDLVVNAIDAGAVATSGAQEIRDEILADSTPFNGANIDASISSRATQADILSDANPFPGANVDAAVSSRAVPGDAMALTPVERTAAAGVVDATLTAAHGAGAWTSGTGLTPQQARDAMKLAPTGGAPVAGSIDDHLDDVLASTTAIDARLPADPADESNQLAEHTATQAMISLLNNLSQADVQAALTAQGYTVGRAALLDNLDAAISTVPAAVDVVLTAAHGAGSWAGGAGAQDWTALEREQIRYRLAMDGTQSNPATGVGTIEDILTNTAAVDARLPADPAAESVQLAAHAVTQAAVAALNNLAIVDVQTALTNQGYTPVRAGLLDNLTNLDAAISSVVAAIAALNDLSTADVQTAMTAQGYTLARAALLDNLLNLDIAVSAVAVDVDVVLTAAHGVGPWTSAAVGDWTSTERESIRQALGVPGTKAGAAAGQLQDVLANTAAVDGRLPASPGNEVSLQAAHAATLAAIVALEDLSQAQVQAAATAALDAQGYSPGRAGNLDNLDVAVSTRATPAQITAASADVKGGDDRDLSELAGVGWAPATDTLEAIRGAIDDGAVDAYTAADRARDAQVAVEIAAVDGRLPSDPADESLLQASHAVTQAAVGGLNDLSQAGVQAALTAQGYTAVRALMIEVSKQMLINGLELSDGDTGNWILRADNGVDVLLTFSVTDKNGDPIVLPPGAPARRTGGV